MPSAKRNSTDGGKGPLIGAIEIIPCGQPGGFGVANGARTHNILIHSEALCH